MKNQNRKTAEYFAKRQEQNMKRQHDRASRKMRIINRDFDKSVELLEKDINKILGNVRGLTPQEVRAKLNETISNDEYNKLLELYRTTKNKEVKKQVQRQLKIEANKYRISRKEAIIDSINRERLKMTDSVLTNTTDQLRKSIQETSSMFGGHFDNEMVDSILNSKWAGNNYAQRIWNNQRALASTLQSELMQAFIAGKTNKDIARVLEQYTDYGRHVTNRLIRTETSYMVNKTDLEDSKNRGIKAKKFEANLDSRTSKICRENNQKIIPIDKIKVGENAPPLHPYCRSFLSDVLKGWDYKTDEELNTIISENEKQIKLQEAYIYEQNKIKKILKNFSPVNIVENDYIQFSNECNSLCSQEELRLINRHKKSNGTIGGYFQTGNSFIINRAIKNQDFSALDADDIKVIETLKKVIPRVKTKKDYLLHRFDYEDCLSDFFNETLDDLAKRKSPINKDIEINKMLSTSMIETNNVFTNRPVKWEIKAPNGSNIFANGFIMETEALIVEKSKIRVLNVLKHNGKILIEALLL